MNTHFSSLTFGTLGALLLSACGAAPSEDTKATASAASAITPYDATAAVEFANAQWACTTPTCAGTVSPDGAQPNYVCAEFASRSVAAGGGVAGFDPYSTSAPLAYPYDGVVYNLRWVSSKGPDCGVLPSALGLQDYLDATGEWDDWSTNAPGGVAAGDVVFTQGVDCGSTIDYGHVVFGVGGGNVDAHNNAHQGIPASWYTINSIYRHKTAPPPPPPLPIATGLARAGATFGWWDVTNAGKVTAHDGAAMHGDPSALALVKPIVAMASTADGQGYWLTAADGGVFTYGDGHFHGSTGGKTLAAPIVGIVATPDGQGYWLAGADGDVFAFGDAKSYGSMAGKPLAKPVVGIAATSDGAGYWLVASDGGIFSFGDAKFHGSLGATKLNKPIVGIARTPDDGGYWLVASDGGIFALGDAKFEGSLGSAPPSSPVVGIIASPSTDGYLLASENGVAYPFAY